MKNIIALVSMIFISYSGNSQELKPAKQVSTKQFDLYVPKSIRKETTSPNIRSNKPYIKSTVQKSVKARELKQ